MDGSNDHIGKHQNARIADHSGGEILLDMVVDDLKYHSCHTFVIGDVICCPNLVLSDADVESQVLHHQ